MLTLYRRHKPTCPQFGQPRSAHNKCKCKIWADGVLGSREIRCSMKTRDWTKANRDVQQWEAAEQIIEKQAPVGITPAWDVLIADLEQQHLAEPTIRKYKLLKKQMIAFAGSRRFTRLEDLDLEAVTAFRVSWKDGPRSSAKKLERLRAFFRFALKRKWITENPASDLKAPKVKLCPTMPYTHEEMIRILSAIDKYREEFPTRGKENALRLRALVLLLRYTGMRIGDAVRLTADRIKGNRLFLYTQKTDVPVNTVLPDFVLRALEATPKVTPNHYFWNGMDNLETVVGSWRKRLAKLFALAEVPKGHAHRFRDTFAVELLLVGVPIERVSVLLGHQSIRVTEKHYSPWVRSRQEQLEADLTSAWNRDTLLKTAGTNQVQMPTKTQ